MSNKISPLSLASVSIQIANIEFEVDTSMIPTNTSSSDGSIPIISLDFRGRLVVRADTAIVRVDQLDITDYKAQYQINKMHQLLNGLEVHFDVYITGNVDTATGRSRLHSSYIKQRTVIAINNNEPKEIFYFTTIPITVVGCVFSAEFNHYPT